MPNGVLHQGQAWPENLKFHIPILSEGVYSPWRQMGSTSVYELNIALKTEKLAKITGLTLFLLLIFRASVMIWRPDCEPKHDLS